MNTPAASQSELQCPDCAGQCCFSAASQMLECESCGSKRDLASAEDHKAASEFPYDPQNAQERPDPDKLQTHHCTTCGGDVVFVGPALSERCPYCNGPVVLGVKDTAYQTMALIPFGITADFARQRSQKWIEGRLAAPKDLGKAVAHARVAGLYVPFWTFDSEEAVQYWAMQSRDKGPARKIKGKMHISFDDLLVPASPHVTPLIRDGILHAFDPASLRPYRAGYLAGFAAEQHHQSIREGLKANATDKYLLMRNRIKQHINKSRVHNIGFRTDTSGIHYRRILLPVWILHYDYKGQAFKVVVSGIDGRTFGERPFSYLKLAAYSAALSAVSIGLGLFWGATAAL